MPLITIKEYAENNQVPVQAVYQAMNRKTNKKLLDGHIIIKEINNKQTKFLDEEAQEILNAGREHTAVIIQQEDTKEQLKAAEAENKNLLIKVAEQADKIAAQAEQINKYLVLELEANKTKEIAEQTAEKLKNEQETTKKQAAEIEELKQKLSEQVEALENEKNRKLSLSERFFGKKKKE